MDEPSNTQLRPIHIISDGTGETAEKVVRAALRQFRGHVVYVHTHGDILNMEQLRAILRQAAMQNAFIVTTLVSEAMRDQVARAAAKAGLHHIDLLGSILDALGKYLEDKPAEVDVKWEQAKAATAAETKPEHN